MSELESASLWRGPGLARVAHVEDEMSLLPNGYERSSRPRRVLLVGPPGAGKTSQGKRLAGQLGARYLSTGTLLREEVRRGSPVGLRASRYMSSGALVPDWLVLNVLEHQLVGAFEIGVVLDGYPRTLEQAQGLTRSLGRTAVDSVIEFLLSDDVAVARLAMRTACEVCGEAPQAQRVARCVRCGAVLSRRPDDDPRVVRDRLRVYRERTSPMLAFFARMGVVMPIDANRPEEEVAIQLLRVVAADAHAGDLARNSRERGSGDSGKVERYA